MNWQRSRSIVCCLASVSALTSKRAPCFDRDLPDVTVDVNYTLHVPDSHWDDSKVLVFNQVMAELHGRNVWDDPNMEREIQLLGIRGGPDELYGSTLNGGMLLDLVQLTQPRLFLEVGVFRGSTSISVAKLFDESPALKNSFVISMDTWLLDLRFVWNAPGSEQDVGGHYFDNTEVAGASQMYFQFLENCRTNNVTSRIIPLQSASVGGAMSLLAHKIRPDLIYLDASHSNPDIYVDMENFYNILAPGGALAFDDLNLPPVSYAFDSLVKRYGLLQVHRNGAQGYILKPGFTHHALE